MVEIKIENGKSYINNEKITKDKVESIIDYYDILRINRSLSTTEIKVRLNSFRNFIHPNLEKWDLGEASVWNAFF